MTRRSCEGVGPLIGRLSIGLFALLAASPAYAEVGDKVPSTLLLWGSALAVTAAAIALTRFRPWLGLMVLPLGLFQATVGHMEITSPDVGPAIVSELGSSYIVSSYVAYVFGLMGPVMAVLWARRAARR